MEVLKIFIIIFIIIFILIILANIFNYKRKIFIKTTNADIIIIGLGTAGSIITRRLHDNFPNLKIIVLEYGQDNRNNPIVYNIANAATAAFNKPYSQVLKSDNQNILISTATLYGGGSSHNYGLVVHGSPFFYNQLGKSMNLTYENFINYFKIIESYTGRSENKNIRGINGKLQVYQLPIKLNITNKILPLAKFSLSKGIQNGLNIIKKSIYTFKNSGPLRASNNFSNNMVKAISELKFVPIVEDYNINIITCASTSPQLFIDPITGLRSSTDVSYLPNNYINMNNIGLGSSKNGNLSLIPNAKVNKINKESVEWINEIGQKKVTNLSKNGRIILCAGAIYSPFLLKKSGFNNPQIGSSLTTHYGCTMILSVEIEETEDFNFSSGPLAFIPRKTGNKREWQIICGGAGLLNKSLLSKIGINSDEELKKNPKLRYFVFLLWNLNPRTRGQILFESDNELPIVKLNLFKDGDLNDPNSDLANIIDGMRFMYELVLKLKISYPTLNSVYPPMNILKNNDKFELNKFVQNGISLTDHYSCTCSFSKVVNAKDFSLIDFPNIHIVDASVFPIISDGNTEFPVCVLAEVGSERIIQTIKKKS